jgi:hypothetical protein
MGGIRLMLVYRIIPYKETAADGTPFSASYLHPKQGLGRVDNPRRYKVWYLTREPEGAVAEVFGGWPEWDEAMFKFGDSHLELAGAIRVLVTLRLPDDLATLDLDHAYALHERGMRPTSVVERNRSATQSWALRIFEEADHKGDPSWQGIQWWSFHRPYWRILGLWGVTPQVIKVEPLFLSHPAVLDAADALGKVVNPPAS